MVNNFIFLCNAEIFYVHFYSDNEFLKPLSDDLKTKIKAWNDIDVKIFTKANETFWKRYKAIPNVEKLEQEFKYETGSFRSKTKIFNLSF